jgi:hypothetical protein
VDVGLGFRAHSGWAALVAIAENDRRLVVVERGRVEMIEEPWQKHPYHAAEDMDTAAARDLIRRGTRVADRLARIGMEAALERQIRLGHRVSACAVLTSGPMPDWSVEEITAVHFRMHKAEGALFKDALARAADACGLRLLRIPEKDLGAVAAKTVRTPAASLVSRIAALRKTAGPPWGKDQKDAALAGLVALRARPM